MKAIETFLVRGFHYGNIGLADPFILKGKEGRDVQGTIGGSVEVNGEYVVWDQDLSEICRIPTNAREARIGDSIVVLLENVTFIFTPSLFLHP